MEKCTIVFTNEDETKNVNVVVVATEDGTLEIKSTMNPGVDKNDASLYINMTGLFLDALMKA